MKKLTYILFLAVLLPACTKDEKPPVHTIHLYTRMSQPIIPAGYYPAGDSVINIVSDSYVPGVYNVKGTYTLNGVPMSFSGVVTVVVPGKPVNDSRAVITSVTFDPQYSAEVKFVY